MNRKWLTVFTYITITYEKHPKCKQPKQDELKTKK